VSQPILEIKDLKVCYPVEARAVRAVDSLTLWYTRNAQVGSLRLGDRAYVRCWCSIPPRAAFDSPVKPW
jgi:hypothetical protein